MNLHYQYYWFKEVIPHDICDKIIQMGNKRIKQTQNQEHEDKQHKNKTDLKGRGTKTTKQNIPIGCYVRYVFDFE